MMHRLQSCLKLLSFSKSCINSPPSKAMAIVNTRSASSSALLDRFSAMARSTNPRAIFHLSQGQKRNFKQFEQEHEDFEKSLFFRVFLKRPQVLTVKPERLEEVQQLLKGHGAKTSEIELFLCHCPKSLLSPSSSLESRLRVFSEFCSLKGLNCMKLVSQLPILLDLKPEMWKDRYTSLRPHFDNSKLMVTLINEAPSVLVEEWEQLEQKIIFFYHTMHVAPYKVAESGALQFDLQYLQPRYLFLERCGLYKHPSHKSFDPSSTGFPLIEDILIEDIDDFLKATTQGLFNREDFDVFLTLLAEEEEEDLLMDAEESIDEEGRMERIREMEHFKEDYDHRRVRD